MCRLPFREKASFGTSRHIAIGNIIGLEKRFAKSKDFEDRYVEAMQDYFKLGHAQVAPHITMDQPHYFIPH